MQPELQTIRTAPAGTLGAGRASSAQHLPAARPDDVRRGSARTSASARRRSCSSIRSSVSLGMPGVAIGLQFAIARTATAPRRRAADAATAAARLVARADPLGRARAEERSAAGRLRRRGIGRDSRRNGGDRHDVEAPTSLHGQVPCSSRMIALRGDAREHVSSDPGARADDLDGS